MHLKISQAREETESALEAVQDFFVHLNLDKFNWPNDAARIPTDVQPFLLEIRARLFDLEHTLKS